MSIIADFTVDCRVGDGFSTVTFTDLSVGVITERKWILGDGTVVEGNETTVKHTYESWGKYDVTLVVRNATEQDTKTKTNYIIVNERRPVSNFIIMQSFDPTISQYWRFYIDTNLYLVYENKWYVYRSKDRVLDIRKWSFLEFDVLSEKMYVGSFSYNRREISCMKSINSSPLSGYEKITEVAPQTHLKIDELKIWGTERNLYDYCKSLRGQAGYLDSI